MQANLQDDDSLFDSLMSGEEAKAPEPVPKPDEADQEDPETPANEAGVSVSEAEKTADETADETESEVDFNSLPPSVRKMLEDREALRQQNQRLSQDYAAMQGRLAPTQRKLAELERKLTESAKASPGQETATQSKAETAAAVGMTPAQWEKYAKDFPEEAQAIEARFQPVIQRLEQESQAKLTQLEKRLAATEQSFAPVYQRMRHQQEVMTLESVHPDWADVNSSPEFQEFLSYWRQTLPQEVQEDDERYAQMLNTASIAINLVTQFKRLRPAAQAAPEPPSRSSTARAAVTRLSAAPAVRGTAPPRRVDPSQLDDNAAFDAEWERLNRTR